MINAILLRSRMNRKVHVRFWSRVRRSDLPGLGIEIGQNRLFEQLRRDGFLIKRDSTDYNMPTQKSMELGLFKIKETAIMHNSGPATISKTAKVTGKGQQYFVNYFINEKGDENAAN